MWPPEWWLSDEGAGEEGALVDVQLRDDPAMQLITISVNHCNNNRKGVILLDDPKHLKILYHKLKDNIGRSLREIGDFDIDFLSPDK
jgi:hypothetical protein